MGWPKKLPSNKSNTFCDKSKRVLDEKTMDPYAAQWAHYGYSISAPADASATAAQAAYPAYYNYQQAAAAQAGAQVTTAGQTAAVQAAHAVVKPPPPPQQRQRYDKPPPTPTYQTQIHRTLTPVRPQVPANPPPPTQTYYPTKAFVKAGTNNEGQNVAGGGQEYDAANSVMKLHQLALHNHLADVYEKAESALPQMQAVKVKLGTEEYVGMGTTFKAAKADAATKALADTKLSKPPERKTLKARPVGITATQELHELATKKGLTAKFKFLEPYNFEFKASMRLWSKEEVRGNYRVQLTVGTMEFMGHADLPQQAKHNASVQALPYLHQMPDIKPPAKAAAIPKSSQSKEATEAASMTKEGKNVIMVLNEIAMQQQVCIDWNIVDEDGPPHMRAFTYTLKMGSYEAVGSGNSKKLAKAIAAQNMYQTIPDDWKTTNATKAPKKKQPNKRKKPMPTAAPGGAGALAPAAAGDVKTEVITSTNTTLQNLEIPGEKRLKSGGGEGIGPQAAPAKPGETPVYSVIQTANPISALYEYCKKVKYPDPVYECVSENVLETWQKNNHTFKKTEYTMKLEVAGKSYFGSANTKKAAKTAVSTEAWNVLRTGTM